MKRKNLEQAIIMSIVLMGLSNGCLAAEPITSEEFNNKYSDSASNSYVVKEDVTVSNEKQAQIGSKDVKTIQIADGKTLTLENVSFNDYTPTITGNGNIVITLEKLDGTGDHYIVFKPGAHITADSLTVKNISGNTDLSTAMSAEGNSIKLDVKHIDIYGDADGVYQSVAAGSAVEIKNFDTLKITGQNGYGLIANNKENVVQITGNAGSTAYFESMDGSESGGRAAVGNRYGKGVNVEAGTIWLQGNRKGVYAKEGFVTLNTENTAGNKTIDVRATYDAVYSDGGTINLKAETNTVVGGRHGIVAELNDSTVNITGNKNIIAATSHTDNLLYGDKTVIWAAKEAVQEGKIDDEDKKDDPKLNVNISAATENIISGTIRAENNTTVTVETTGGNTGGNKIYSSAQATDYDGQTTLTTAVFASEGATVNISAADGQANDIRTTFFGSTDNNERERVIWAQKLGTVNIDGETHIVASKAEENTAGEEYAANSNGIAITAGSSKDTGSTYNKRSEVNLTYKTGSYIIGDIVSGFNGAIGIKGKSDAEKINIRGNLFAANRGSLELDLGGGIFNGRIDDYGDADIEGHNKFYNPVFTNDIESGGNITLHMGDNSRWVLNGQSWLTNLTMDQGSVIDLSYHKTSANTFNENAHALTIRNIGGSGSDFDQSASGVSLMADTVTEGAGTFIMDLNHNDHLSSDMVYIGSGKGTFDVVINTAQGLEQLTEDNELRFATVGSTGIGFDSVRLINAGLFDVEYKVGSEDYREDDGDNNDYNGGSDLTPSKPGDDNVSGIKNWFINGVDKITPNNNSKLTVDLYKANYSNAVYMDRLNKRLGEARYIDGDEGLWVRMRHDRIGKSDAFRSKNTMYEIGYDKLNEADNGERRVGFALDYMDGDTEFSGIAGKGEITRKGIWLYDTWLGNKGHYADYVAKWGHLSNSYETGYSDGDYSNNVFSVSAEYGRKKAIGNDWYFEPQAQLQYARVTDGEYVTNLGSRVSMDAIDSLIARAGFRLGRDLGERSTVYVKADVLHEFLGEQNILAVDSTGTLARTFDNDGTWYDIGLGFATAINKDSYIYMDFEKSFGNDFDDTYQINVGLQYSF